MWKCTLHIFAKINQETIHPTPNNQPWTSSLLDYFNMKHIHCHRLPATKMCSQIKKLIIKKKRKHFVFFVVHRWNVAMLKRHVSDIKVFLTPPGGTNKRDKHIDTFLCLWLSLKIAHSETALLINVVALQMNFHRVLYFQPSFELYTFKSETSGDACLELSDIFSTVFRTPECQHQTHPMPWVRNCLPWMSSQHCLKH